MDCPYLFTHLCMASVKQAVVMWCPWTVWYFHCQNISEPICNAFYYICNLIQMNCIASIFLPSNTHPDSKVHGASMGPTWVLSAPDGPHVGPMNLAIRADNPCLTHYGQICGIIYDMLPGCVGRGLFTRCNCVWLWPVQVEICRAFQLSLTGAVA